MTKNKIRILIAEDHEIVREGVKMIIEMQADMIVVGEAQNGREAIEMAQTLLPEIVIMDVSMPELNGLVATAKLKRILPDVKIITLTRHSDEAYLREILQAGASGYILKQSASEELLRGIRAVASGESYLDSAVTGKVLSNFMEKRDKLRGDISGAPLTERETEILREIAFGYSNREIAERYDISIKTVEAHKANALKKLNMNGRKDIIRYAILQNWLQEN